jgi:DNA-binding GntR family transcriptional regulator
MSTPSATNAAEVASLIRTAIVKGEYARGAELPTQTELAEKFGTHQGTVSRAVAILTAEGLIQPVRGKRAIVTAIPPIVRNASVRYSRALRERDGARGAYDAEVRAMGLEPSNVTTPSRAVPPERVADILNVPADEESTVVRARVMFANDTITQLADSYIPGDIAFGTVLEQDDEGPGGMVSRMAEMGFGQVRVTERLRGRPATKEEAHGLKIADGQQIYDLEHVGWAADGRAVEVCIHLMPQSLWILDTEFLID